MLLVSQDGFEGVVPAAIAPSKVTPEPSPADRVEIGRTVFPHPAAQRLGSVHTILHVAWPFQPLTTLERTLVTKVDWDCWPLGLREADQSERYPRHAPTGDFNRGQVVALLRELR